MSREERGDVISRDEIAAILYQAARTAIGLVLVCSDREQARQKLYAIRRELCDPALAELQIRVSPTGDGDLVLLRRNIQVSSEARGLRISGGEL